MTRTVLIGKGRRITLDELESVACHDGLLEMHSTCTATETETEAEEATTTLETSADISSALSQLSISDDNDGDNKNDNDDNDTCQSSSFSDGDGVMLSNKSTIAAVTLVALTVSQGRIIKPESSASAVASILVDLVNADRASSSTHLRLSSSPSLFGQSLANTLSPLLPCPLTTAAESTAAQLAWIAERAIPLARTALAASEAKSLTNGGAVDVLASLSAERTKVDAAEWFSDLRFDLHRPHRGMLSSAAILRALLHGSKFACKTPTHPSKDDAQDNDDDEPQTSIHKNMKRAVETIPQYHGPAAESIAASCKVLELECNCFELNASPNGRVMDQTVLSLANHTLRNACTILLHGANARSGLESTSTSTLASTSTSTSIHLEDVVAKLKEALGHEIQINTNYLQTQIEIASQAAKKKAQEKAARALQTSNPNHTNATDKDEFEGMSQEKIAKILKKRAEKEAKAAKKKAAKEKAASSSSAKSVALLGAGTTQLISILTTTPNTSTSNTTPHSPTIHLLSNPTFINQLETLSTKLLSGGIQRKPKIPKGTRDYLPEQMMVRDEALQIIRRVFRSHGAVEIDTPVFELKDTLTGKYGEDSKLIYDLADQGGELLALRYDLTVPFARFLALHNVGNIKRFHIGKVYRRDQPALTKGRYREFYQCDFDIAGTYGRMVPDSECLAVAADVLSSLPIGDFGIKVNHRKLLDAILDLCGVPSEKFRTICSAVDKLDKEPWSEVKREMVEDKGLEETVADKIGTFVLKRGSPWEMYRQLMDANIFGTHQGALHAMEDLNILFKYLDAMGKLKYISFDLSLARGLDYYTGVIYEAVCMNGNTQVGSIGGGGRYDNLVSMFQEAGKITPCVGVSIGIERVFTLMEERLREGQNGSIKRPNVKVLIAQAGENMMLERMKLAKLLWDSNISAEFNQQENPKLKFEIANALDRDIPFMVIIGEEEEAQGKCKVKDLKARTEELVDQSQLVSTLLAKGVVPVGCEFAVKMLDNFNFATTG